METASTTHTGNDQHDLSQLEHLRSVLASTQMGTWKLYIRKGGKIEMYPDSKMKEIIGLPADNSMTGEEMCNFLVSRIHHSYLPAFDKYNQQLISGERAECTYRWNHPTLGDRYMRCGGIAISTEGNNILLNGYHYDVTDQVTKEIRSNHIVKTFARTYEFINYLNLDDDTFFTYVDKEIEDETVLKLLMSGIASKAIEIGLNEIVSEEYRKEVAAFSDLSTMNERMAHQDVIYCEFKDVNGSWQESSFTIAERKKNGDIKHLLWAVRHIDNQKQMELRKQKILEDNIAANKAKSKFLHNMSHEIRTPLNAMYGYAQLLGMPDGSWTDEEKQQYSTYIYRSYKMLEMLINDVIDVADSEQDSYSININDVFVNNACKNALMSVEFRKPDNVKLYMTSDFEDDFMIRSDARRIQQVLINYLSNACKHTTEGEIHLHCSKTEHPGKITFSVSDTGCGIPKEKANMIFERFTKLNDHVQGTGLGLNICKTIAEKMDGQVYLDTSYTQGARFVFVIDSKQA